MMRVVTLFSGYDSQCMALDRIGVDYELVAWAEIDKHAIRAHDAVYPQWSGRNLGDVSAIDWSGVGEVDLLTYSSPCQDFSQAGLMRGGAEGSGTRSALLWEVKRAIEALRPKYLLMENVKALVGKRFVGLFNEWLGVLEDYGYTNSWSVLNARDYGVPQNRERVFVVSSLDGLGGFGFPRRMPLVRRLRDVLECDVDVKYYLKPEQVESILQHCDRKVLEGCGFREAFKTPDEIATCLTCKYGSRQTDTYIVEVVVGALRGRGTTGSYVQKLELNKEGVTNTLTQVAKDNLIVEYGGRLVRVRRLTPSECFRLMDVDEGDLRKIMGAGISETQLCKLAGNSIVVSPMAGILRNLLKPEESDAEEVCLL